MMQAYTMKLHYLVKLITMVLVTAAPSVLVLSGCQPSSYDVWYQVEVTETISGAGATESGSRTGDPNLRVNWRVYSFELTGEFANPSDKEAMILWDGAVYSYASESEPLVATTLAKVPDLPQPPTAVPAGGKLEISMLPRSNADWRWYTDRSEGGFWYAKSHLFGISPNHNMSKAERQQLCEAAIGKQFVVRIPIKSGGSVLIHEYHFRVIGAKVNPAYY
jgi:hypothetical protein